MKNFSVIELSKGSKQCLSHRRKFYEGYFTFTIYCMTLYEQNIIYSELMKRYMCLFLEEINKSNVILKSFTKLDYGPIKNFRFLSNIDNLSSRLQWYKKKVINYRLYISFRVKEESVRDIVNYLIDITGSNNFKFIDYFGNIIPSGDFYNFILNGGAEY